MARLKLDVPQRMVVALGAIARAIRATGRAGMIIGGVAAIARGSVRTTDDIDIALAAEPSEAGRLLEVFARHELMPRIADAASFAQASGVLLLVHEPTKVLVDLGFAFMPFELEAIEQAESVSYRGERILVARAEDLVIYKSVAWRPQDRLDVERLLTLHGSVMDLDRVRANVRAICEALEEPERPAEVERLMAKVLNPAPRKPAPAGKGRGKK